MKNELITKICTKCKIEKPISEFHKKLSSKDGFQSRCKECFKNRPSKQYDINIVNEHIKKGTRKTCCKCEVEKPVTEFHKDKKSKDGYNTQCKECRNKASAEWYKRNKEKKKASCKKWEDANKDKRWNIYTKRKDLMSSIGKIKIKEYNIANIYFKDKCIYCNGKYFVTDKRKGFDHIISISKGGINDITNIVKCCKECNSKKKDLDLEIFLKRNFTIEQQNAILQRIYDWKKYLQENYKR